VSKRSPKARYALVLLLLAGQGVLARWTAGRERPPAPALLSACPGVIDDWKFVVEDSVDPAVVAALGADALLSRTYSEPSTNIQAGLLVAWFRSLRGFASQPHSPRLCLPAAGLLPRQEGEASLETAAGSIRVNRMLVAGRTQRAAVLYWYQTPRRVSAGEWEARLWLIADSLRDSRTDTALVRVLVWSNGDDDRAAGAAARFAQHAYPALRQVLPR
jgi:EpsI family protein